MCLFKYKHRQLLYFNTGYPQMILLGELNDDSCFSGTKKVKLS